MEVTSLFYIEQQPIKCCSKETHMPAFFRLSLLAAHRSQGVMSLDPISVLHALVHAV